MFEIVIGLLLDPVVRALGGEMAVKAVGKRLFANKRFSHSRKRVVQQRGCVHFKCSCV